MEGVGGVPVAARWAGVRAGAANWGRGYGEGPGLQAGSVWDLLRGRLWRHCRGRKARPAGLSVGPCGNRRSPRAWPGRASRRPWVLGPAPALSGTAAPPAAASTDSGLDVSSAVTDPAAPRRRGLGAGQGWGTELFPPSLPAVPPESLGMSLLLPAADRIWQGGRHWASRCERRIQRGPGSANRLLSPPCPREQAQGHPG